MIRQVAALQRLQGLSVDGLRQYYESSLYWVFWYLGVPAVLLACAGAVASRAAVGTRGAIGESCSFGRGPADVGAAVPDHRLVGGHRAVGPGRRSLAAARVTPAGARGTAGTPAAGVVGFVAADFPCLGGRRLPRGSWACRACCVLALVIPPLVTTLNPGLAADPSVGRYSSGVSKFVSRVRLRGVGVSPPTAARCPPRRRCAPPLGRRRASCSWTRRPPRRSRRSSADFAGSPRRWWSSGRPRRSRRRRGGAWTGGERSSRLGRRPVLLGPSQSSVSLPGVRLGRWSRSHFRGTPRSDRAARRGPGRPRTRCGWPPRPAPSAAGSRAPSAGAP